MLDVAFAQLEEDPYPIYARLRREAPVAYVPAAERWLITRWDDCTRAGTDADSFGPSHGAMEAFFGRPNILGLSGAEHRALRHGIDPPFRPRAVRASIEGIARPIASRYVAATRERGSADATTEILERISVRAMGDMLGFGDVGDDTLQDWFHALSAGLVNRGAAAEPASAAQRTMREIDAYMRAAIDRLTAAPDASGLSHMIHTGTPRGQPRCFDELIGSLRVIVLGALQEPGHGAANTLYGLLSDRREQLARVLAAPDVAIPLAVHEGLRWLAPFGLTDRCTLRDVEIGGVTIPAGQEVGIVIASANRDEARFERPDTFDLDRPHLPTAAFGHGAHFCSGHAVSRELERIALEEVLRGLPNVRLDPDRPPLVRGFTIRGATRLPVVWDA
jgi:cytochrome P450